MYAEFFGLKQSPFSIAPDPRYLFMSERHREALAHLLYGLNAGGGFVLLTGEIGAGKTTVCRCFLEQIPANCNIAYILNPKLNAIELLQTICDEFQLPHPAHQSGPETAKDCLDPLNAYLLDSHAAGQNNVLIIDEAQNLSPDVLEQLRLLTNLETSERKLLQIILIGQPELRRMIAQPALEQLAQRIIARFHLGALTEAETAGYIAHRLGVAGLASANPFKKNAMHRVHLLAQGIPRRINLLCDRALLGAYVNSSSTVERRMVDQAAAEVFDDGGPPSATPSQGATTWLQRKSGAGAGLVGTAVAALAAAIALLGWTLWPRPDNTVGTATAVSMSTQPVTNASKTIAPVAQSTVATSQSAPKGTPVAPLPTAPTALSAPVAATTPPVSASKLSAADLTTRFPRPTRDVTDAWRALAPAWKLPASTGDTCQAAERSQIHCFRIKNISLPLIQQLNRPGIITLMDDHKKPVYAVLTGLNDQGASLQMGTVTQTVPLESFTQLWQGDFATFWRVPPGYATKNTTQPKGKTTAKTPPAPRDNAVPGLDWIAVKLAQLNSDPKPTGKATLDAALVAKIRAFQLAHGLKPDGVVGATTFMQINRATGVAEPRLQPR